LKCFPNRKRIGDGLLFTKEGFGTVEWNMGPKIIGRNKIVSCIQLIDIMTTMKGIHRLFRSANADPPIQYCNY
jgi:hypothetical protein